MQPRIWVEIIGPYHTHAFARPKRDRDHIARRELKTSRYAVRIGLVERHRHQNIDDSAHSVLACLTDSGRLRKSERSSATLQNMTDFAASSDVSAEITRWMGYLGAERRMSQKTVECYRRDVAQFLDFLAEHLGGAPTLKQIAKLTPADIRAFMAFRRSQGTGNRSLMRTLAGIRSFARFLERKGQR
jgi:hypothetical protein